MNDVKERTLGKNSIKVITSTEQNKYISPRDAEMDARATKAVRSAVEKAEFCKKPIAKYDSKRKEAYIEYPNGEKKYVK